jgi:hypothetical protein
MYDFFNVIFQFVILLLQYIQARKEMMYSLSLPPPPPRGGGGGVGQDSPECEQWGNSPAASVGKTAPDLSAYYNGLTNQMARGSKYQQ